MTNQAAFTTPSEVETGDVNLPPQEQDNITLPGRPVHDLKAAKAVLLKFLPPKKDLEFLDLSGDLCVDLIKSEQREDGSRVISVYQTDCWTDASTLYGTFEVPAGRGFSFIGSNLWCGRFEGNFSDCDFRFCDLRECDFSQAVLTNAKFQPLNQHPRALDDITWPNNKSDVSECGARFITAERKPRGNKSMDSKPIDREVLNKVPEALQALLADLEPGEVVEMILPRPTNPPHVHNYVLTRIEDSEDILLLMVDRETESRGTFGAGLFEVGKTLRFLERVNTVGYRLDGSSEDGVSTELMNIISGNNHNFGNTSIKFGNGPRIITTGGAFCPVRNADEPPEIESKFLANIRRAREILTQPTS